MRKASRTGAYECLVAERRGTALGLAMFYPTFSSWSGQRGLFLEDLYVREAARGLSVGRLLLAELARIAGARGATRIDLVVQGDNRARGFYTRLGLRELPGWHLWRADEAALAALAGQRLDVVTKEDVLGQAGEGRLAAKG